MNKKSLFFAAIFLGLISCCNDNQTQITIKGKINCVCNQGYYGPVGQQCQQCPQGSTSGSPDQHSNQSIGFCSTCQKNYFMSKANYIPVGRFLQSESPAICNPCPSGSGNSSGSDSLGDQTQCNTCQPNYFMTAVVSQTQAAQCSPCPHNSGNQGINNAGDQSQCNQCQDNTYMTALAQQGQSAQCSPCPPNSYSSAPNSLGFCTCFDPFAIPLSSTQNSCICQSGYAGNVATTKGQNGCYQCANNQFVSGNKCVSCADGSTVNKDLTGCTCNDTSDGTIAWNSNTNICQCKPNYYGSPDKASQGSSGSCKLCPQGLISKAGSKTADQCQKPPPDSQYQFSLIISNSILISFIFIIFY
ncbi:GCC2 and GCC3 family protein (macronuclear) [Tetrahymena thermophila SB210]|uniref:GCC2 and GCC3 family protein n=1 Tax=Tetrahymena thermophila (strain SB210) TaxID=312017 RepID=Q24DQ0_TETTS|nr:GCC2 and GCC3 family protein [Tetrahymena thermophila SB210]EAS05940.2 GCC2 and GCC3 family protein [Tetrahymena thermophila SB210]|eukprot:XP_001026185.2 GCC2 and GCC3 family protein [Tetrahymena thermophila SB210]